MRRRALSGALRVAGALVRHVNLQADARASAGNLSWLLLSSSFNRRTKGGGGVVVVIRHDGASKDGGFAAMRRARSKARRSKGASRYGRGQWHGTSAKRAAAWAAAARQCRNASDR